MNYVVGIYKHNLKIAPGDIRQPGDPIPEAKKWKPAILEAHKNLKWVQSEEEYKVSKAIEDNKMQARKKANLLEQENKKKDAPKVKAQDPKPVVQPKAEPSVSTSVQIVDPPQEPVALPKISKAKLRTMERDEVVELAKKYKVSSKGNKNLIIKRITEAM